MSISIVSTGLIYRNTKPHLRAVNAWHPTLAIISETEILAAFELGQAPESLNYHPRIARSTDGGQTWSGPTQFIVPGQDFKLRASMLGRISRMSDGTIVGLGAFLIRNNPNEGILNHANFGYVPTKLFTVRSRDGGHNWSFPELF